MRHSANFEGGIAIYTLLGLAIEDEAAAVNTGEFDVAFTKYYRVNWV